VTSSLLAAVTSELERRLRLFAVLCVGVGYVLVRDLDATPYDDAYFFKRFAVNFLNHGSFAWNPGDGSVQGLTSQLYQVASVGLVVLAPEHAVLAGKVLLAICLAFAGWLLVGAAHRLSERWDVAVGVSLLAIGCPLVAWTLHSGMETALALLVVTWGLRAIFAPDPAPYHAPWIAFLTVLAYLARPDVALIPAVTFVLSNLGDRRRVALYLASLVVLLGALLGVFHVYYGSALPLAFYAKTRGFGAYDAALRGLGAHDKLVHVATFVAVSAPLVALARPRGDRRAASLLVASALFVGYHAVVTNEIMGYRARFYAPALIPLALAAALGARRALAEPRSRRLVWLVAWALALAVAHGFGIVASASSSPLERIPWQAFLAELVLAGWLVLSGEAKRGDGATGSVAFALFLLGIVVALPPRRAELANDRELVVKSSAEVTTTRGIFDVERCLPAAATVYHSEIGVPGLVLPRARIVDLAGLMSREIALERPPFDAYCSRDRPEAIFLPHRNYVEQNREIVASACLREYTRVVRRSSSPLYVRNDLVAAFGSCARDVAAFR
jgi:hypothetical protein